MAPAFKEWAVIVHALLEGEQMLDVRKGGLREEGRHFAVHAPRVWGLSPLGDQELAGATMVAEQAIVLFAVFAYWFRRFLAEEGAT